MAEMTYTGPPKYCARCDAIRPASEFYGYRHSNGRVYASTLCKAHERERARERMRQRPRDEKRATHKRYRERRKHDPERYAIHIAQQRDSARRRLAIPPERWRNRRTPAEAAPMLDVAPFAAWLATLGDTTAAIARQCGLPDQRVRQYLRGMVQRVELDVVDRACLHADADLNDLYPIDEEKAA